MQDLGRAAGVVDETALWPSACPRSWLACMPVRQSRCKGCTSAQLRDLRLPVYIRTSSTLARKYCWVHRFGQNTVLVEAELQSFVASHWEIRIMRGG